MIIPTENDIGRRVQWSIKECCGGQNRIVLGIGNLLRYDDQAAWIDFHSEERERPVALIDVDWFDMS